MGVESKQGEGDLYEPESHSKQIENADRKRDEKVKLNREMWQRAQDFINIATSENSSPESLQQYIETVYSRDPNVNKEIEKARSHLKTGEIQPVQAYIKIIWAQVRSELAQREAEIDKKYD